MGRRGSQAGGFGFTFVGADQNSSHELMDAREKVCGGTTDDDLIDDDLNQAVCATSSGGLGERRTADGGGRLVRSCDTNLYAGGASTHRSWADPVNSENRKR